MKIAIGIDLEWPFEHHYGIAKGILDYGKEKGWQCSLVPWMEKTEGHYELKNEYDGVISRATPSLAEVCKKEGTPLVNVWYNSPVKDIPLVSLNGEELGRKMADYFLKKGFKNIVFLGPEEDRVGLVIHKGMSSLMSKYDLECKSLFTESPRQEKEWKSFFSQLDKWINKFQLPLAVACLDHLTARYLIEWCKSRNYMVPDDLAILSGFSNHLICESFEPSLSHVENIYDEIGYKAASVLDDLMSGKNVEKTTFLSPGDLRERRSTDVEPVSDRFIARAMRFIWDNSVDPIQVESVATYMKMSRRSLERRFRKVLDRTVNEEILRTRVERAKRMLKHTDKTAKAIAEESGFASNQRMSQVFREKFGMTALEFRNEK